MSSTGAVPARSKPTPEGAITYDTPEVVRHLAHELRQPLSTIETIAYYLEIVLPRDNGKVRHQLEKLQEVVQQTSWILSDAVHFLQASPPSPQLVDLNELLSESISESARGERVWASIELSAGRVLVRLDPEQGRHLVHNLLVFFRQLSSPDSELKVRTSAVDAEVHLEVSSTGLECSVAELESMLEPFNSHLPAGSGLALASVRRITEVHGGRIEFHSGPEQRMSLLVAFPLAS